MLTVHHLGMSQSERIVWLCEELDLDHELIRYDRLPSRMAPPEYKALHPLGQAPVIRDGAVLLAESGAIVDYILGRYGQGRLTLGPDDPGFADELFWFHYANASMMAGEMGMLALAGAGVAGDNPSAQWRQARSEAGFALTEARLGHVTWFAGEQFTKADIMMVFPLSTMRAFTRRNLSGYPNILAYLARIAERPAYRRAMERGDPGMALLLD